MKRILLIAMAAMMAFSLAACGGKDKEDSSVADAGTSSTVSEVETSEDNIASEGSSVVSEAEDSGVDSTSSSLDSEEEAE